jgi:Flp pilus assembly protein TadD
VRADLERVGTYSTADLWSLLRLLPGDVDALVREAPRVNRDDNLYIELATPLMLQEDTLTPNWEAFARFPRGVLPLLEAVGEPVEPALLGELALSYIERRTDPTVGPELLRLAQERGRSAPAIVAAVVLGRSVDSEGSFAVADQIASLDDAIALDPGAFAPRLLRAEILAETQNHPAALEAADAALLVRPDDPRARVLRAKALYALERWDEALAETEALAAAPPALHDEDVGQRQAELYVRTGRTAEAIATLERELEGNDPTWLEGWMMLAQAYAESGDASGAERARRNARATVRNRARSYQWLARSALWRGWNDEAIPLLETALKAEPDNPVIASDLAALQAPQGGADRVAR